MLAPAGNDADHHLETSTHHHGVAGDAASHRMMITSISSGYTLGRGYKNVVLTVADKLGADSVGTIVFLKNLPEDMKKTHSPLEMLQYLERHGEFSARRTDGLVKLLEDINRSDLVPYVIGFNEKTHSASVMDSPQHRARATASLRTSMPPGLLLATPQRDEEHLASSTVMLATIAQSSPIMFTAAPLRSELGSHVAGELSEARPAKNGSVFQDTAIENGLPQAHSVDRSAFASQRRYLDNPKPTHIYDVLKPIETTCSNGTECNDNNSQEHHSKHNDVTNQSTVSSACAKLNGEGGGGGKEETEGERGEGGEREGGGGGGGGGERDSKRESDEISILTDSSSLTSPNQVTGMTTAGGNPQRNVVQGSWKVKRKDLFEMIFEHKNEPLKLGKLPLGGKHSPRLLLSLLPWGCEGDAGYFVTLDVGVEVPRTCDRAFRTESVTGVFRAMVKDKHSTHTLSHKEATIELGRMATSVYKFLSHLVVKNQDCSHFTIETLVFTGEIK